MRGGEAEEDEEGLGGGGGFIDLWGWEAERLQGRRLREMRSESSTSSCSQGSLPSSSSMFFWLCE